MNPSTSKRISYDRSPVQSTVRRAATVGYFGSFIIFGLLTAALGATLPGLAENTGSALSRISFIFTAQALGYLLGSLSGGRLFDGLPGHKLLSGILISIAVLAILIPIITSLLLLLTAFLILGAMQGALEVGDNTLLVWQYRDKVGPYMNALHFFFGVGAILSPVIIARTAATNGNISWVYWSLAILAIPVAIWLLRLPSPKADDGKDAQGNGQVNYLFVILIALLLFLYVGAEAGYGGWVYTYTLSRFPDQPVAGAALLTSAFWGALTIGRLVSIPLAVRVKPGTVLVGDLLGCLLSMGVVILWSGSWVALWLGTLGLGFFMASFFPTTVTLAGHRMQITGRVTGWFFVGAGAGGMFLPWIIGQLFENTGPGITIALILVDLLVALMVLAVFLFLSTNRSPGRIDSPRGTG